MIRRLLLLAFLGMVLSGEATAQAASRTKPKVYDDIEQPVFPGGADSLLRFLSAHTCYPEAALQEGAEGKVYVRFAVNTRGDLQDFKVLKGVHPALDAEALRVLKTMPRWKPGRESGKLVNMPYVLPLTFMLTDEAAPGKTE